MSKRLTLVDTSAFIEFSRRADSSVAGAVDAVLEQGCAAVCEAVVAELLSGCPSRNEYRETERLLSALEWLPVTEECWTRATALGFKPRRSGITVPLTDRLVVAVARVHEADLLHHDTHFEMIGQAPDALP